MPLVSVLKEALQTYNALIPSRISFVSIMVIPKHCNSATFSTALLVVFVI
jgi:hypothetical protein